MSYMKIPRMEFHIIEEEVKLGTALSQRTRSLSKALLPAGNYPSLHPAHCPSTLGGLPARPPSGVKVSTKYLFPTSALIKHGKGN